MNKITSIASVVFGLAIWVVIISTIYEENYRKPEIKEFIKSKEYRNIKDNWWDCLDKSHENYESGSIKEFMTIFDSCRTEERAFIEFMSRSKHLGFDESEMSGRSSVYRADWMEKRIGRIPKEFY